MRLIRRDILSSQSFLLDSKLNISFMDRLRLIAKFQKITASIESPHTQEEVYAFAKAILTLPKSDGVIVEAGCFKGSSTAKFSLAAHLAGRKLIVFDSFQGIPKNNENHDKNIYGGSAGFPEGSYCGALEEVKANVNKYGALRSVEFVEGWFDDSMPHFDRPISAIYLDVDLVSSTTTCLKYLYPLLEEGGVVYSQDGHLPLIIELLEDESFWKNVVGFPKPDIRGLRNSKLLSFVKHTQNVTV